jgi:signal transduction histidine kinase
MVNYVPERHEMEIYSDLNQLQYKLPQIRCLTLLRQHERRRANGLLLRMDHRHPNNFRATFETIFHDQEGRSIFLTFNMVPVTEKDGTLHYFGMCQDNTEMVYTERRLQVETEKALETEALKSTFLMNMSHEIRTPLNAVLGFAELFNNPHAEEDEPVFAEEIKRNTGELLQLVNDILYISRLDAKMEVMRIEECDFAAIFEGYCYMGWSSIGAEVKVSVENPYNHLYIAIDAQHLGEVIQKICEHAALNTNKGSIRAKYEYRHGELNISIEDTGRGLSEAEQKRVFERFARSESGGNYSTGLDMPIIKELIEQMGGSIELQSAPGKGCTVYVIIPCVMSSMEKKTEITI